LEEQKKQEEELSRTNDEANGHERRLKLIQEQLARERADSDVIRAEYRGTRSEAELLKTQITAAKQGNLLFLVIFVVVDTIVSNFI
jgi:hypothetical protein